MFKRVVDAVEVLALIAAVVTVAFLFAPGDSADTTAATGDAEAVYSAKCAACHGSDGGGGVGPALGDGAVVEAYPDVADQIAVITEGRAAMPSFGDDLSVEEIEAIATYTRDSL